jgi:hypothetical protein
LMGSAVGDIMPFSYEPNTEAEKVVFRAMAEMTVFGGGQESPDSPRPRAARRLFLASPLLFFLV